MKPRPACEEAMIPIRLRFAVEIEYDADTSMTRFEGSSPIPYYTCGGETMRKLDARDKAMILLQAFTKQQQSAQLKLLQMTSILQTLAPNSGGESVGYPFLKTQSAKVSKYRSEWIYFKYYR